MNEVLIQVLNILAFYVSGVMIVFILGIVLNKTLHTTVVHPRAIFWSWIAIILLSTSFLFSAIKTYYIIFCMKFKCKNFWKWYKNEIY